MGYKKTDSSYLKIAIIICYFGKFPWYFDLFLHSASFNKSIDFIIITDSVKPPYCPSNVKFLNRTLNDINILATQRLGFKVNIENPYKLCDFKPTYGLIFSDILEGYNFWGHGDIDIIWGNIRNFITNDLSDFDFISVRHDYVSGFFALYRNTEKMNTIFMQSKDYMKVLSSPDHFCFDECSNLYTLLWNNKNSIYDIQWEIESMTYILKKAHDEKKIKACFELFVLEGIPGKITWDNGVLYFNNRVEVLLYHLILFKKLNKPQEIHYHSIPLVYQITKSEIILINDKK